MVFIWNWENDDLWWFMAAIGKLNANPLINRHRLQNCCRLLSLQAALREEYNTTRNIPHSSAFHMTKVNDSPCFMLWRIAVAFFLSKRLPKWIGVLRCCIPKSELSSMGREASACRISDSAREDHARHYPCASGRPLPPAMRGSFSVRTGWRDQNGSKVCHRYVIDMSFPLVSCGAVAVHSCSPATMKG